MSMDPDEKLRWTEGWLREEIRANRVQMLGIMQWGVTVLAGVETSLYYLRRDVTKHLVAVHQLKEDQLLPSGRWFVGTVFLTIIAITFCIILSYAIRRHVSYRRKLIEVAARFSKIEEEPTGRKMNYVTYFLFLVFPMFDAVLWFYFYVGEVWIKIP